MRPLFTRRINPSSSLLGPCTFCVVPHGSAELNLTTLGREVEGTDTLIIRASIIANITVRCSYIVLAEPHTPIYLKTEV